MTVVTEGRAYKITTFELDPDIVSGKKLPSGYLPGYGHYVDDGDYIEVMTSYIVPDGMWVMERSYDSPAGLSGVTREEIEVICLDSRRYMSRYLWVSSKPFGFTNTQANPADWGVICRRRLDVARQIHKGELGRSIPIPHVDYVRQPLGEHERVTVTKPRERRRGRYGWVKLAELGEMTVGYDPDDQIELILKYWQFSGHLSFGHGKPGSILVDIVLGSSLEIRLGDVEVLSTTRKEFQEWATMAWEDLWIRRGFAYTILRLQALGVEPAIPQSV